MTDLQDRFIKNTEYFLPYRTVIPFIKSQNLGEYYAREHDEHDIEEKDMSSSSLRRKLFFHGDVGTPLSPVR